MGFEKHSFCSIRSEALGLVAVSPKKFYYGEIPFKTGLVLREG
jgi:hypothetical protein